MFDNPIETECLHSRVQSGARALTLFSVRRARSVLVMSWLVALVSAALAMRLSVQGDFARLLPQDSVSVAHVRLLAQRTRVLADYLIGIEGDDPRRRQQAAADLRQRLESLDPGLVSGITADRGAYHRFTKANRFLFVPISDLRAVRDAIEQRLDRLSPWSLHLDDEVGGATTRSDFAQRFEDQLTQLSADSTDLDPFISGDGRLQMFILRTTFTSDDSVRGPRLNTMLQDVAQLIERKHPGVRVGMTGDVINTAGGCHFCGAGGSLCDTRPVRG